MSEIPSVEDVQKLISRGPYHQWLGLKVVAVHEDGIELTATWREEWVVNPERRYTHGGVLAALIDLAADWVYTELTSVNLSWANELATYMFVWMAKFGAALGVRTGIHVGVDVFVKQLSPAARKPVIVFALLSGAMFTGVIGTLGAVYVYELDPDQVSQELEWPSWIIYLCIPLGSYLMCFRFLQVAWRFLMTGYVPHQGHGLDYEAPHEGAAPMAEPAQ